MTTDQSPTEDPDNAAEESVGDLPPPATLTEPRVVLCPSCLFAKPSHEGHGTCSRCGRTGRVGW